MAYVLENKSEANRLRFQQNISAYNIAVEFNSLHIPDGSRVLDAGCGEGALTRYLLERNHNIIIEGIDFSEIRVKQATKNIKNQNASFFQSSLEDISIESNYYDCIGSRYVFEHLRNPQKVSNELYRVLKPNGKVCICDFDNLFTGFYTTDEDFNKAITLVQSKLGIDFNVGRKIPAYLTNSGFAVDNIQLTTHLLHGNQIEMEKENYRRRFSQMYQTFSEALSGIMETDLFFDKFISLMDHPGSVLYMNKFVISAKKPSLK